MVQSLRQLHHAFYGHPLGFRILQGLSQWRHPLNTWRRRDLAQRMTGSGELRVDPHLGYRFIEPGESAAVDHWISGLMGAADQQLQHVEGRMEEWVATAPTRFRIAFDLLSDSQLQREPRLLELLTEAPLLEAAMAYLGSAPVLRRICLGVSPGSAEPWSGSQLFHLDGESDSQLKLFVLLSDVEGEEDGPLTFLNRAVSQRVTDELGLGPRGRVGSYTRAGPFADKDVLPHIASTEVQRLTGRRGRALLLDTCSVLHYGSRVAAGRNRLTLMAALQRDYRAFATPSNRFDPSIAEENSLRRLALEPAGRQKPCGYYFPESSSGCHPITLRGQSKGSA